MSDEPIPLTSEERKRLRDEREARLQALQDFLYPDGEGSIYIHSHLD